jgi:serine/threonine protein phosphatase PrpC
MIGLIVAVIASAALGAAVGRVAGEAAGAVSFLFFGALSIVLCGHSSSANRDVTPALLARSDMLAKPITTKHGESGVSARFRYGLSCMQGWRRGMEDAHTAVMDLSETQSSAGHSGSADHALFSVFDGHRGATVAKFCGANLPQYLVGAPAYSSGRLKDALVEAYVNMDLHLKKQTPSEMSGCTAVSLLVTRTELMCANAGDSRCVLCRDGRAVPLSFDHKPNLPSELRRIQRAGGFVFRGRVQGVLALSRAIGDFPFKQRMGVSWEEQAVTCVPEVQSVSLDARRDEFVVVACDGIWDVMSSQDVVNFVRSRLARNEAPQAVCEQLMDACLAPRPLGLGCDNMSVIILDLRAPKAA